MAKKKRGVSAAGVGVSRRRTVSKKQVTSPAAKGVAEPRVGGKKATPKKRGITKKAPLDLLKEDSEAVRESKEQIKLMTKEERELFAPIQTAYAELIEGEVMGYYNIGKMFYAASESLPRSDVMEKMRKALNISSNLMKHYLTLARAFGEEELRSYAKMSSPVSQWKIPWSSYLLIAARCDTPSKRKTMVLKVLKEQMTQSKIEQSFPLKKHVDDTGTAISGLTPSKLLKKLQTQTEAYRKAVDIVLRERDSGVLKDVESSDLDNKVITSLAETLNDFRSMQAETANTIEFLEELLGDALPGNSDEEFEDEED